MNTVASVADELRKLEKPFAQVNQFELNWQQECLFARQQIDRNEYSQKAAANSLKALQSAILNVAAIGISLNPAASHAFLVPRAPKHDAPPVICLDIAYRGLVKLATDCGSILWAKAVLVYQGDTFTWKGPAEMPDHQADVLDPDRIDATDPLKNLRGGYCLAKLPDGSFLVEVMTAGEILEVRATSKAQNGPWKGRWAGEMAKKTLVKRASKSWPQSNDRARFDRAVSVLNEHEGIEVDEPIDQGKVEQFHDLAAKGDAMALLLYSVTLTFEEKTAAFNAAPKGEKTKFKDRCRDLERQAHATLDAYADEIRAATSKNDAIAIHELHAELTDGERALVDGRLTDIERRQVRDVLDSQGDME